MSRLVLPLFLAVATAPAALAQPKVDPAPPPTDAGAKVYKQSIRSVAWIHSERGAGKMATGSGSLIDKGRRLVLTNYHVVGDVHNATVFFPDFGADRKVIPERKHYLDRANKLGIPGEVVEIDKEGDLVLIRIDRLPDGTPELPLAAESPDPGQSVHSIGNPGKSGALWVYTPGKVRQVYSKKWRAKLDERTTLTFEAKVIETDSPTNPGDSGGPLVNDKGELVGVTQGGAIDAESLSVFVDLSEVKRLLARRSVQALRSTETTAAQPKPKEAPKPHRDAALKSKDEGRFFSVEAMRKLQETAEKLLKEKGVDLVVETFETLPKFDADKLKAMPPADREKVFKEYAAERTKAEKLVGVYVVVNKVPGFLYVVRTEAAEGKVSEEVATKMRQALIAAFKDKKFDGGLDGALNLLLDSQKLGANKDEPKEEKK